MTDIETGTIIYTSFAGLLLGVLFFGGLWWSVQRGLASKTPALWFISSFIIRTTSVLAGFLLIANNHVHLLPFGLLGFVIARFAVNPVCRFFEQRNYQISLGGKNAS